MAVVISFDQPARILGLITYAVFALIISVLLLLTTTYVFTNLRYWITLKQAQTNASAKVRRPVKLPYTIPFLGNAFQFLDTRPGYFWNNLVSWYPRATGSCTLKMGGNNMHILLDSHAIQALFKAREPARHKANFDIAVKALGVEHREALKYYGLHEGPAKEFSGRTPIAEQEHLWATTLLKADRVNELTAKFIQLFGNELSLAGRDVNGKEGDAITTGSSTGVLTIGLSGWLRSRMFKASTEAFYGTSLMQEYPGLEEDYMYFDQNILTMYFGIPRWLSPKPYAVRDRLLDNMVRWREKSIESTGGQVSDPDGIAWDSVNGSRAQRARLVYYKLRDLALRSQVAFDLGFLFGISSNSIPASSWMLMHILDPKGDQTVYPRVMKEINASKRADGTFDVTALVNQPLLLSIFHEILRLYVDALVTREMPKDLTVPVGGNESSSSATTRYILLSKDSIVTAPSWAEHHNQASWPSMVADVDTFYADRFLVDDPAGGDKKIFSTAGTAGKFFPFGGGKTICPGRAFAKQEVMASVAMILDEFEFEVVGFLGADGKTKVDTFPAMLEAYPGGAVLPIKGDMEVKMKKRRL